MKHRTLEKRTGDCIGCGRCDRRCPSRVKQGARMQGIKAFFRGMREEGI